MTHAAKLTGHPIGVYPNRRCLLVTTTGTQKLRLYEARRASILGPVLYTDENDKVIHVEDNVGLIEHCKKAYKANGLGEDFVDQFIR